MGKTWILQTDTKGTGATMVPLESVTKRRPEPEPLSVPPEPKAKAKEPQPPKPRAPRRFRIVDVMTRRILADDAGAAQVIDVLRGVRSTVDVEISVWVPERERWRLLTFSEQRTLFEHAAR